MKRRAQLLSRIRQRYQTLEQTVTVGPLRFPFVRVEDPDRVLDEVAAEEDRLEKVTGHRTPGDQLHLPYWAELWDSAQAIGQYLVRTYPQPSNLSALDLGCGMGLSGTVAARLGMRVLFADLEPPALLFAQLNSLPDANRVLVRRPDLRKRYFGVRRWTPRIRTRRLNWQTDRLNERFDLIIGADILYERKQWDFLEPFWRAHLNPAGTVLLGEPGRQTGDLFQPWIRQRGWEMHVLSERVETRLTPIRLLLLRRAEREE